MSEELQRQSAPCGCCRKKKLRLLFLLAAVVAAALLVAVFLPKKDAADALFHQGLVCVRIDGQWGYANKQGKIVIQPQYRHVNDFDESGLAAVCPDGDNWGYINKKGEYVLPPQENSLYQFYDDGLSFASGDSRYWIVDQKGQPLFDARFERIIDLWYLDKPWKAYFSDGYAIVRVGEAYGVIDKKGNFVLEPKFDYIGSISYDYPPDMMG